VALRHLASPGTDPQESIMKISLSKIIAPDPISYAVFLHDKVLIFIAQCTGWIGVIV
jgi:hypothetical protein